ncbi:prolyl oligopeptidase family serine peptidase [Hymenobacter sp. HMF4947]|uniref:Prolyl oligopeptidase family serine peptidase n=1 Tax=Hymenobacter ginkgonis TaxID=2682976 RepID=A0A7K1TIA4_9BACT|nr:lipase family protein [Hymenobacter ginkgonis]MVN78144.1 prolyl oligopeptidase family serine peptidase [Hymenobacter ginkgonis]
MKALFLPLRGLLLALLLYGASGCHKQDNPTPDPALLTGQDLFVSATPVATVSQAQLQALATAAGFGAFTAQLKYNVSYYKFLYKTTYKGQLLQVSGMLGIPLNMPTAPALLSAQHGTMFRYADAPSNFPATFTGFELFASTGFVTLIPDFVGLGVSSGVGQSFYDKPTSAGAVVDMIKAAKYYLSQQQIALNQHLFLVGYSEGGYVTMAAQQEIETNPLQGLTLTAAAEGAGGYDLPGMLSGVASASSYATPAFLALFLQAYNTTYDWNRPLTDFFQAPYAAKLPALLDGTHVRAEIDAALTTSPAALFTPAFYASLSSPSGEPVLKQKMQDNSFANWVPRSPTRLYHGTADESVFYQTSASTFARFQAAGATNVEFFPITGGTHESSIVPMMANALPWLQSLN